MLLEDSAALCGLALVEGGVKTDDPQAEPLHIVDRTTGLFNDRFVRPVLEDELARAHRYQRNLGVLLIETNGAGSPDEALKLMAAAAIMGLSKSPKNGYSAPAAIGTPRAL